MLKKKAQQEMAGFILIVVMVVVGLMVFLVISLKKPQAEVESEQATNILSSILRTTSNCIVNEPDRESVRDLFRRCYDGRDCANFNVKACSYLNKTVSDLLKTAVATEPTIEAYELTAYWEDGEDAKIPLEIRIINGYCNSSRSVKGAMESISAESGNLNIYFKFC
jgi:hypothetical protein